MALPQSKNGRAREAEGTLRHLRNDFPELEDIGNNGTALVVFSTIMKQVQAQPNHDPYMIMLATLIYSGNFGPMITRTLRTLREADPYFTKALATSAIEQQEVAIECDKKIILQKQKLLEEYLGLARKDDEKSGNTKAMLRQDVDMLKELESLARQPSKLTMMHLERIERLVSPEIGDDAHDREEKTKAFFGRYSTG